MKKKILAIIIAIIILTIVLITITKLEKKKDFYTPIYNNEYITSINNIEIKNENIKEKYQFVYISDLHASIIDENEKDEKIKSCLVERNDVFTQQHVNKVQADKIFQEIINYANNSNSDALLLGGDIIDSPSESNFNFLRNNLNKLKKDYLYTLGNHDWSFAWDYHTKEAQEEYYPKFTEFMNDAQVSYLEYKDLIILAINDSKDKIEEEAIDKIKQVLEKKKQTIVMLHVPLATEYISEETARIRNRISAIGEEGIKPTESTQKAIDLILSEEYNVFYIISGHVHFDIKDNITKNIIEDVSAPAYGGNINLIKINN
ncbi:MAG: metallophosphoesterase family protein [Candidatus Scatovivens sp.]